MINGWMLPSNILYSYQQSQLLAIHSRGFYVQMAICANSPWLADLVSELYAELQLLDQSIVGSDLVFFIINKVPEAADDASMMLLLVMKVYRMVLCGRGW